MNKMLLFFSFFLFANVCYAQQDNYIYYVVESMPEFQGGGPDKFREWVESNLRYNDKSESTPVIVNFVVEKDGSLSNFECVRSPDASLTEEVYRVMRLSPKWEPGMQREIPKRVRQDLRVDFMEPSLLVAKRKADLEASIKAYREKHRDQIEAYDIFIKSVNAGPETWIDVSKLHSLIPKATKPIIVLFIVADYRSPCVALLNDWYDILQAYDGLYDRYIVPKSYAQGFQEIYGVHRYPTIMVFNKKGDRCARYTGYENYDPGEGFYENIGTEKARADLKEWFEKVWPTLGF